MLAEVAEPLVAVHGQSDQHRLLQPGGSGTRWTGSPASALAATASSYADLCGRRWSRPSRARRGRRPARERAREADLLRFGLGEVEAVDPQPGEDAELAAEEERLGHADGLRTAAETAREALSERGRARPTRWRPTSAAARGRWTASATTTRRRASSPTGSPS